jgi:hypothetical protein
VEGHPPGRRGYRRGRRGGARAVRVKYTVPGCAAVLELALLVPRQRRAAGQDRGDARGPGTPTVHAELLAATGLDGAPLTRGATGRRPAHASPCPARAAKRKPGRRNPPSPGLSRAVRPEGYW